VGLSRQRSSIIKMERYSHNQGSRIHLEIGNALEKEGRERRNRIKKINAKSGLL
jgi:hypothetical protein